MKHLQWKSGSVGEGSRSTWGISPTGLFIGLLFGLASRGLAAETSSLPETYKSPTAAWRAAAQWDTVDEPYTIDIHKYTTDLKYLTPIVGYMPKDKKVPSPREVLGYSIGTEGKLTLPADEIRYFEALAKASPRVLLLEMGKTEEGHTMHLVVVSDEDNIKHLKKYKEYTAALSDPRKLSETEAAKIIAKAKPIMHFTAGLHSPETGPPEMVMELAYRLAVSKHPDIEAIRENVITLITPVTEVDGRAEVVEWYNRYFKDYDNRYYMPSMSPPYWGKYAFHDNNRDGIQMTQMLTQNYVKSFHEWHPTYSLDMHESVPLLYVSTGTGPYNEYLDPIVVSEWQWLSNWEIGALSKWGLPGVWTWGYYDGWNPSYLLWVTNNHNSLGRFYETFGNATARTMKRDLEGQMFAGKPVTSKQWYRFSPPPEKEFTWSLRNNTNYMESAALATLSLTAREGKTLLQDYWLKGNHSIERGKAKAPYGWVIPADQPAHDRVAYLVNQLRHHAIEVNEATADFKFGEKSCKKGDYVVRLDQPYSDFARSLLTVTYFPKDAEQKPYDDVSWTLGIIYRVETTPVDDKSIFELKDLRLLDKDLALSGIADSGSPAGYAVKEDGSNSLITARYKLKNFEVTAAEEAFESGGVKYPPGSWIVRQQPGLADKLTGVAKDCALDFHALTELPKAKTHPLDLPRLALYHNWISTQDDGWVRYTLERAGVPYTYINDDAVKAGGLRDKFDVILMANQGPATDAKSMIQGRDPKFGAMPYTKTTEFPDHGNIDSSNDITGGIGFRGMANLEEFLDKGGTLILLGSAGRLASDGGLLRNVSTLPLSAVNTPGAGIQTKVVRRDHPIAYGYEDVNHIFRVNGPVYTVPKQFEHWIVVQYGTKDAPKEGDEDEKKGEKKSAEEKKEGAGEASGEKGKDKEKGKSEGVKGDKKKTEFLLCGYVSGQSELERKAVVLDVPRNRGGRVILYSFNPLHRFLNVGDNNYVYNAILNWNDFPDPKPKEHPGLAKD